MNSMISKYQRAEQLLSWNLSPKLKNLSVEPHWLDDYRFWFKRYIQDGYEFILVDTLNLTQNHIFDHERLAVCISDLLCTTVSSRALPIARFEFCTDKELYLEIFCNDSQVKEILVDQDTYRILSVTDLLPPQDGVDYVSVISPDGRFEVYTHRDNLGVRELSTGSTTMLTQDGVEHFGYGNYADYVSQGLFENICVAPAVMWSPDGDYLAVQRIDERQVKDIVVSEVMSDVTTLRPKSRNIKMALPGDENVGLASLCVIELESTRLISCDRPPIAASNGGFMEYECVYWGPNNCIYYVEWSRDRQIHRLVGFDYQKGISFVILEEKEIGYSGPWLTPMFGSPIIRVLSDVNEFIWYSRRNGWGHLYRYDLVTGELKNPITSGAYVVTNIHCVDTETSHVYFTACGRELDRDPYFEHFYRVNLDGSDLVLLTPEASQHDVFVPLLSPNPGNRGVFLDTISRVDQPSRSVLRSIEDGSELMVLSEFDNTALLSTPYTPPVSFSVKAHDDNTDLWGVMYLPSDFDESKSYPVILMVYGTPQVCITPKRFAELSTFYPDDQFYFVPPIAELGFIVVVLDPRGTPLRSKAFHDVAYHNLQNGGGIDDQVAALEQLGKRHSWIDLNRVGITGYSGGGFASSRAMLSHSDFFKVGVSNAGNHDQRLYCAGWVEPFQGLSANDNYVDQASMNLAQNLKGKLLLTHGDCDANVHVAHTMQLVNMLIEHNRDFDLLVLPNRKHMYHKDTYFIRRLWDYFVEHLLEQSPAPNYLIKPPNN